MIGFLNLISASGYNYNAARIAAGVLMCIMAAVAIAIGVVVLLQKSNQNDITSITGGSADTYYNNNKEMSKDKKLKIATIALSVTLAVLAIVFFIIAPTARVAA